MVSNEKSTVQPRARVEIHNKVVDLISTLGSGTGKRVLDAPLGPGSLALKLREAGYRVSGVDLDLKQSDHLPQDIERKTANLNETLPFADGTFDLVTSLEGIEHLENHYQMLRELSRVAKRGGHLILTTPNICTVNERLNFLLRGTFDRFVSRDEMEKYGSGHFHQNLIGYVECRQALDWAGFELLKLEKDNFKWRQNLFLGPLAFILKAYAWIQSPERSKRYLFSETSKNNVLLGGNTIIFVARKR